MGTKLTRVVALLSAIALAMFARRGQRPGNRTHRRAARADAHVQFAHSLPKMPASTKQRASRLPIAIWSASHRSTP